MYELIYKESIHIIMSVGDHWFESLWTTLYGVAYLYPNEPSSTEQEQIMTFVTSVTKVVNIEEYKQVCESYILENSIKDALQDRGTFLKWVNGLHNFYLKSKDLPEISLKDKVLELNKKPVVKSIVTSQEQPVISSSRPNVPQVQPVQNPQQARREEARNKNIPSYGMRRTVNKRTAMRDAFLRNKQIVDANKADQAVKTTVPVPQSPANSAISTVPAMTTSLLDIPLPTNNI